MLSVWCCTIVSGHFVAHTLISLFLLNFATLQSLTLPSSSSSTTVSRVQSSGNYHPQLCAVSPFSFSFLLSWIITCRDRWVVQSTGHEANQRSYCSLRLVALGNAMQCSPHSSDRLSRSLCWLILCFPLKEWELLLPHYCVCKGQANCHFHYCTTAKDCNGRMACIDSKHLFIDCSPLAQCYPLLFDGTSTNDASKKMWWVAVAAVFQNCVTVERWLWRVCNLAYYFGLPIQPSDQLQLPLLIIEKRETNFKVELTF